VRTAPPAHWRPGHNGTPGCPGVLGHTGHTCTNVLSGVSLCAIFSNIFLTKMPKKITQQAVPSIYSSKQKANQQSAPLATSASTPEKAKKPKAAESAASLPSPPLASTPEKVKQLKAMPADSALAMVPHPPPAETAKLTLPVAAVESSKDTADASLAGEIGSVSESISANAAAVNAVSVNAMVNPVTEANQKKSLGEEEESDDGSSSHSSNSSGEEYTGGSDNDEEYKEDSILVGGKDEEDEELDQKPPVRKGLPVEKPVVGKLVAVPKKQEKARSSAVAMGRTFQLGSDTEIDDRSLLLSNDDEAGKKVVGRSSDDATVVTMLKEAEGFFNLSWKDYVSVYALVYGLFL
jgi:hypothetical protein